MLTADPFEPAISYMLSASRGRLNTICAPSTEASQPRRQEHAPPNALNHRIFKELARHGAGNDRMRGRASPHPGTAESSPTRLAGQ